MPIAAFAAMRGAIPVFRAGSFAWSTLSMSACASRGMNPRDRALWFGHALTTEPLAGFGLAVTIDWRRTGNASPSMVAAHAAALLVASPG
ncbi:hypothetical protein, partial [Sphingomonas sp.]|uniref:hypothetical protein n=1 Tax=Sphingomonas sp. TaxID=28214 RepID=UPI00258A0490